MDSPCVSPGPLKDCGAEILAHCCALTASAQACAAGLGLGSPAGSRHLRGIRKAFPEQHAGPGSRDGLGSLLFDEFWSYSGHRRLEQGCICIASRWGVTNDGAGALPLLTGLSHGYPIPRGAGSGAHSSAGIAPWKGWSAWVSSWKGWGRAGPRDACPWRPARAGWGSPREEYQGTAPSAWQRLFEPEVWPCLHGGAFKGPAAPGADCSC